MDRALVALAGSSVLLLLASLILPRWLPVLGGRYLRLGLRAFLGATALLSLFVLGLTADSGLRKLVVLPFSVAGRALRTARGLPSQAPGAEGHLVGDQFETIRAAVDERSFWELDKAVAAHDGDAIDMLALEGRVLPVRGGTKVQIVDSRDSPAPVLEVQVLEGRYAGRSVWVPAQAVKE